METITESFIQEWLKIGKRNLWIKEASDPVFDEKSFYKCDTAQILKDKIAVGNWCLGTAFYYNNICFINQIDGGDEWLAIRGNVPFESFTFENIIKRDEFEQYIARIESATDKQLRELTY